MIFANSWAYEAARRTGYRGWFYFPDLDPSQQMPEWTRETIAEKSNWLYNNHGASRAIIDGLALDEVDTGLWPKPHSSNPNFNAAAKVLWQQQCGFHKSFAADAENNFYSAQYAIRREIRLRGDCFGQKLRAGEAASCPQLQLLPAYQCRNANISMDQSQWRDGRRDNAMGRAIQWRFTQNRERTKFTDLDASDVIHFHDPFLIGQKRGMGALAHAARKLFSVDDIERAKTSGVLLRTRVAFAIRRPKGDNQEGPMLHPGAQDVTEEVAPDGSKILVQKIRLNEESEVEVADPRDGREIYTVESPRGDEAGAWSKELLTDVGYGTLYPPDYLFYLAGLTQGTLVRMAQQKVQRVKNTVRDFQLILQLLEEWYPFWLWQNIKAGKLDNVRGGIPDDWYAYLVVRPRDDTVDPGREGRLYDDRIATGKMPAGLYVGMLYGEDEEEFDDAVIRDAYRRRQRNAEIAAELGVEPIPIDQIFRPPTGGPAPSASQAPGDEETPAKPEDDPQAA